MKQQTLFTKCVGTMKHKKAVVVLAIALFVATFASAQQGGYYHDWKNGYSGEAVATCFGTTRTVSISYTISDWQKFVQSKGFQYLGPCSKLSKRDIFLLWSALNEYNYSNNEVYCVSISQIGGVLYLLVVITDAQKPSCEWYDMGYYWE